MKLAKDLQPGDIVLITDVEVGTTYRETVRSLDDDGSDVLRVNVTRIYDDGHEVDTFFYAGKLSHQTVLDGTQPTT